MKSPYALILATILVTGLPGVGNGQDLQNSLPDSLAAQITQHRNEGRYAQALGVARPAWRLVKDDPEYPAWKITDVEWLIATLERAVSLSPDEQRELSAADRHTDAIKADLARGAFADAISPTEQQLEIRQRLLGHEHPDVAQSLHYLAYLLYRQADHRTAAARARECVGIRQETLGGDHPQTVKSLNTLGFVLLDQGDFQEAEQVYRRVLVQYRRLHGDEHAKVASTLSNLGNALHEQGKYAEADSIFAEALALTRKTNDAGMRLATVLSSYANVLSVQGHHADAVRLHREGLQIRREILPPDHPSLARALNNLGGVLYIGGDYEGAEPYLREALTIRRRRVADEPIAVANSLGSLAGLLRVQGNFTAAEPLTREALAIFRSSYGDKHPVVARTTSRLAGILRYQGDYAASEALYRQALEVQRELLGPEHPDLASSLRGLGITARRQGDLETAERLGREALQIWRSHAGEASLQVYLARADLARVLRDRGQYAPAIDLCQISLTTNRQVFGDAHPFVAHALHDLATVRLESGDTPAAALLLEQALVLKRELYSDDHPSLATTLLSFARLQELLGDYAAAETLLAEAAGVFEKSRLRAGEGLSRALFRSSPYRRLAAARLLSDQPAAAWSAVEHGLARALADLIMAEGEQPLNTFETAREDSLRRWLSRSERKIQVLQNVMRDELDVEAPASLDEAIQDHLAAEAAWSSFKHEVSSKYPTRRARLFSLTRVQQALPGNGAYLGWLDVDMGGEGAVAWAYVINRTGPVHWVRLSGSPVDENDSPGGSCTALFRESLAYAAAWLARVEDESGTNVLAHRVWRQRIAPALPHLTDVEFLVVIPGGEMLGVPVEGLLADDGTLVGDRFAISYTPSATIYTWLQDQRPAAGRAPAPQALLVGDPEFGGDPHREVAGRTASTPPTAAEGVVEPVGVTRNALAGDDIALASLARLPHSRNEVEAVSGTVSDATLLLGLDASEQEIVRLAESGLMRDFDLIHIATHALVDEVQPWRSAIVLSQADLPDPLAAAMAGTRIYDGIVSADEIATEWDLQADLVTLSCCQTALGRKHASEGYIGFAHCFLQAGARSLLVSLWDVDDTATSLLMERFYRSLFGAQEVAGPEGTGTSAPMSKSEALQEAKHWLRNITDSEGNRPYRHPVYWSGFIVVGDPL